MLEQEAVGGGGGMVVGANYGKNKGWRGESIFVFIDNL